MIEVGDGILDEQEMSNLKMMCRKDYSFDVDGIEVI